MTSENLRIRPPAFAVPRRALVSATSAALLVIAAGAVGWIAVSRPDWYRPALAIALAANFIVLGMKWPRAAAVGMILFLPALSLLRRVLIPVSGFAQNDPLLLVGPVVALFILYRLYVVEGRRPGSDRLLKLVAALLAVAVIQVFNPLAVGGFVAAAGGLLFIGVPLLWFFIGRELGDQRTITVLLYGTIVIACVVAVYGLFQTQYGNPTPWDQEWIDVNGYGALNVGRSETGSQIRPFSTFASNQEYSIYLAISVTFLVALMFHRRLTMVVTLPLIAVALFLSGGRSALVTGIITIVVLIALRTRALVTGFLVVVLGIGVAYGAAAAFGPTLDRAAGLGGDAVAERNVTGILNPLDPNKSTFIAHWDNYVRGFTDGFKNPAGHGTGSTSIASKLTDSANLDSEIDLSNTFLSLGVAGGLIYLASLTLFFRRAFSRYTARRDILSFAAAGLLVVSFGQLLNGGQYAVAPLLWFFVGWATRPDPALQETPAVVEPGPGPPAVEPLATSAAGR